MKKHDFFMTVRMILASVMFTFAAHASCMQVKWGAFHLIMVKVSFEVCWLSCL